MKFFWQNPIAPVREQVIEGAARAFFVSEWANREEEEGRTYPGEELYDVAPPTPGDALELADEFIAAIERLNGKSISQLYLDAATAPGRHDRDPDPEDFGYGLAMPAMGHGVSWDDDHPNAGIKYPAAQYYGGGESWEGGEIDERFIGTV